MHIPQDSVLLRLFMSEGDRFGTIPLYEAIVIKARERHLAGTTVVRGAMGFGKSSRVHSPNLLQISEDLQIVVEIVDSEEKITAFLPVLDPMMSGGLVTLEKARVIYYNDGTRPPLPPGPAS